MSSKNLKSANKQAKSANKPNNMKPAEKGAQVDVVMIKKIAALNEFAAGLPEIEETPELIK